MNKLQNKSYLSLIVILLLQILFFYLVFLEYKGEKQLLVITQQDKVDREFKDKAQKLSDLIEGTQSYFNKYILFRELPDLKKYNESLVLMAKHLNDLITDQNQSIKLKDKIRKNVTLNENLINLKQKTDSIINDRSTISQQLNLDEFLKPSNYKFEDVLNSVEFETDKKVDSVKKKGLFSRLGSALKGQNDVQKEQINSILRLKFGKKVVSGDIKQQFKNVLLESQKHYNKQFGAISRSLTNIKKGEKNLVQKNQALVSAYRQINDKLKLMIDDVLDDNSVKIDEQAKVNKKVRFYLIITVMVLIVLMLFVLLKYITDVFRVKRKLSEAKDQITKDLFLKNRIISTLTHEIKTPVSIINLYGAFMGNKNKDIELQEFFDTVVYTSNTLTHISNQALELVKNNEGETKLKLEPVNMSEETTAIVNSLKIFASSKNIDLIFKNELPASCIVQYDKAKFYQLVYNIVGNAVKFAKSKIEIIAKLEKNEDIQSFSFTVKDDGIGISKEDKEKIFDLEYQSKNNKSVDALSLGLGLYLCKNIIKASNGTISVESELNKGSQIKFNLNFNK
ncbi:sensor histidine kinase [Flavobacterium columnare]|uniref:sensor histidine kinase n=1 Tax=Flavobacterium columnare TaxID=996 RepID=UPI0007F99A15|nr:HAMP domain-containing sensor histidine kinase [Flavobacterium columnare]ANO47808.1 PAS/PAC domain protein [Flavobacterium columnare]MBF6652229.1 sensor histidine kinase [Flavobacterium columnare]MBF6655066.1 sensor histidine kinase [Flavobacterium columnare]MBF6657808.1 sensor histidine kinase [Flavobacterium columnare]PDS25265.1 sensor histidine kinase [Flavobacterium columnare] [Flavobacterium columnare NBRC 100251 = ATCC 23463]